MGIQLLVGKTITDVVQVSDEYIRFDVLTGSSIEMSHMQDCCERVFIHNIIGSLDSLIGETIVYADDECTHGVPEIKCNEWEGCTLTVYTLQTANGKSVVIRWHGISNGYYSEIPYVGLVHRPI